MQAWTASAQGFETVLKDERETKTTRIIDVAVVHSPQEAFADFGLEGLREILIKTTVFILCLYPLR